MQARPAPIQRVAALTIAHTHHLLASPPHHKQAHPAPIQRAAALTPAHTHHPPASPPHRTQARTAPIQRVADAVAGKFAYGVMGISLATFLFWSTAGTRIFPQARVCVWRLG